MSKHDAKRRSRSDSQFRKLLRKTAIAAALGAATLSGCGGGGAAQEPVNSSSVESEGSVAIRGEVWADNWFAFYLGEKLILEDSVPITTERSFNAESFEFQADYPLQLNFVIKDFRENDTGLEYIGSRRQQMGDGGFIAQFTDASSGQTIAVTNSEWRCQVIHKAPLDKSCENETNPVAGQSPCGFEKSDETEGWKAAGFDDAAWTAATEHSVDSVRPKHGYDEITWAPEAKLIWTGDLETDNTILCRATVAAPATER